VNIGGVPVGNLPSNLFVTVHIKEAVLLLRRLLLRSPRKWPSAIASTLIMSLSATGHTVPSTNTPDLVLSLL
jgi:hypothetical protein